MDNKLAQDWSSIGKCQPLKLITLSLTIGRSLQWNPLPKSHVTCSLAIQCLLVLSCSRLISRSIEKRKTVDVLVASIKYFSETSFSETGLLSILLEISTEWCRHLNFLVLDLLIYSLSFRTITKDIQSFVFLKVQRFDGMTVAAGEVAFISNDKW